MRGGTGVLTSEDTSPVHPVCGPGAACSHSPVAASHGWSGPAPRIMVGLGRVGAKLGAQLHSRCYSSVTVDVSPVRDQSNSMLFRMTQVYQYPNISDDIPFPLWSAVMVMF